MFHKDFYPTPANVIEMMGIDCAGKVVLEPSAGKGDLIDWMKSNGAKEVLACEINKDLIKIVERKARVIGSDFMKITADKIGHVDMIVMNPPFSADDRHMIHAWEIAPDGCEIISLCNWETVGHVYNRNGRILQNLISDYGTSENLGNCFEDAERKTRVEVGLVKLYKPRNGSNEFEGFFLDEDEEEVQENAVMRFDAIRDVVQRYVHAVKCFEEHREIADRMNKLTAPFGVEGFTFTIGYQNNVTTKEDFKKELQKKAWAYLFDLMDMKRFLTSGVMKDINKFVEKQQGIPFTMKNIYQMFRIIAGTSDQIFDRALTEAVDNFTMHTHENRYGVEGWKTNEGHLLNRKFIVGWCLERGYGNSSVMRPRYGGNFDKIEDLNKVLCRLTATNYEANGTLYYHIGNMKMETNTWYEWGFFEYKGFLKGTLHMRFKDEYHWALLNQRYAKIKGFVLPENLKP